MTKKRGSRTQMVSADFLKPAMAGLGGLTNTELAAALGVHSNSLWQWLKQGTCPLYIRMAVNGLLAERAAANNSVVVARVSATAAKNIVSLVTQLGGDAHIVGGQ